MILKRWVEQDCIESEVIIAQIIQNIIPSILKIEKINDYNNAIISFKT